MDSRERDEQYMRALARANEIRIARAEIKRRIARGTLSAAEVILECPPEVQSMAVADLLLCQRRWGRTRCRKLLAQAQVSERKSIGALSERQRRLMASLLSGRERSAEARAPS